MACVLHLVQRLLRVFGRAARTGRTRRMRNISAVRLALYKSRIGCGPDVNELNSRKFIWGQSSDCIDLSYQCHIAVIISSRFGGVALDSI